MIRSFQHMFGRSPVLQKIHPDEKRERAGYWKNMIREFRKNKAALYALRFIYILIGIALLADLLANEKPIVARYEGKTYWPVLRSYAVDLGWAEWPSSFQNVDWHEIDFGMAIHPPIPYSPTNMDARNDRSVSPFEEQNVDSLHERHWLGTDELGRDILSGMIHGTRISLSVGIIAMAIAGLIGVTLGSLAGYFGDHGLRLSLGSLLLLLPGLIPAYFYGFVTRKYVLEEAADRSIPAFLGEGLISLGIAGGILLLLSLLGGSLGFIPFLRRKVTVPVDILVMRIIEVLVSIPTLFLIIALISLVDRPSIFLLMAVIGLTGWTDIARLIRGELLRIRRLEYIEAARALGYSEFRTIIRHAIPNAMGPVVIALAFGIAGSILTEAFLSFLGLIPAGTITWGTLLANARSTPSAWWLALFPGFAIFVTVTVYNLVGEGLSEALDPRRKDR